MAQKLSIIDQMAPNFFDETIEHRRLLRRALSSAGKQTKDVKRCVRWLKAEVKARQRKTTSKG